MSDPDLVIRGGTVVFADEVKPADIAITAGVITDVGDLTGAEAAEIIDATGLHVFPGLLDDHVHFNDPGRADWEGWATGSRALAAGGGVLAIDMPLNASPPVLDAASFDGKVAAARGVSLVDFALWGGLVPGNLAELPALADRGVIGFKAFMSRTGTDDFVAADDLTLYEGMQTAAELGLPVAVHAESNTITAGLAARAIAENRLGPHDYARSRPVVAETEAITRALHLAAAAGCALHIVHVSTGAGIALIAEAKSRGQDVTAETCPHYLIFTEDDLARVGSALKCAPPLRSAAEVETLWADLARGDIDTVASDHSPALPALKTGSDFHKIWGGISGVQSTLPVLLTEGYWQRTIPLPVLSQVISSNVARRFRLPGKGAIAPGNDADFALVALDTDWTLARADLADRHAANPYVGMTFRGKPRATVLRGQTIWRDGAFTNQPAGDLVRPTPG